MQEWRTFDAKFEFFANNAPKVVFFADGQCTCPYGWLGEQCEVPYKCEHGELIKSDGQAKCACFEKWTGGRCEQRYCVHGTATSDGVVRNAFFRTFSKYT